MVTINKMEGGIQKDGTFMPTMYRHVLDVKKDAVPFKAGIQVTCFIGKIDDRFAVWSTDWMHHNIYKVFTKKELDDTFDEQ